MAANTLWKIFGHGLDFWYFSRFFTNTPWKTLFVGPSYECFRNRTEEQLTMCIIEGQDSISETVAVSMPQEHNVYYYFNQVCWSSDLSKSCNRPTPQGLEFVSKYSSSCNCTWRRCSCCLLGFNAKDYVDTGKPSQCCRIFLPTIWD